jgi:hypothetical protein
VLVIKEFAAWKRGAMYRVQMDVKIALGEPSFGQHSRDIRACLKNIQRALITEVTSWHGGGFLSRCGETQMMITSMSFPSASLDSKTGFWRSLARELLAAQRISTKGRIQICYIDAG